METITWIWAGDSGLLAFFDDEVFGFVVYGKNEAVRLLLDHGPNDFRQAEIHKGISHCSLPDVSNKPSDELRGPIVGKLCSLIMATSKTIGNLITECIDDPTPSTILCFGLSSARPVTDGFIGYCDDNGGYHLKVFFSVEQLQVIIDSMNWLDEKSRLENVEFAVNNGLQPHSTVQPVHITGLIAAAIGMGDVIEQYSIGQVPDSGEEDPEEPSVPPHLMN